MQSRSLTLFVALSTILITLPAANAAIKTWDGSSSGTWNTPANWAGSTVPVNGDDVVFPAGAVRFTTTNNLSELKLRSITFTGSNYLMRGNFCTISNGIRAGYVSGSSSNEMTLDLGTAQSFNCSNAAAQLLISGNITNNGNLLTVTGSGNTTLRGSISGAGGLMKTGSGTLQLAGASDNTFTGTTTVNAGTLELNKALFNALNGPLVIGDGSGSDIVRVLTSFHSGNPDVTVNSSGLLDLNGQSENFGAVTLNGGTVTTGSGTLTLTTNLAATSSSSGPALISGRLGLGSSLRTFNVSGSAGVTNLRVAAVVSGTGGIVKSGSGTMTLDGSNTFSGGLTVNNGTLLVNGFQPQSPVTVGSAGILGGTGTIGLLTNSVGGVVAPGASPGRLTSSNVNFSGAGSDFAVELSVPNAGSHYDQLNVAGTINLGGSTLNVSVGGAFAPVPGQVFTIINNDLNDAIIGTFAELPEGAMVLAGGFEFVISYLGGSGNDVTLSFGTPPAGEIFPVLGTSWKYLDDGTDPGTNWPALAFNDSGWSNGVAELGFSAVLPENDEATLLRQTNSLGTNITFYFRRPFNLGSIATISNLALRYKRDDGIIIYLNGAEIVRNNMPTGMVSNSTFALNSASDDGAMLFTNIVSAGLLREGTNVIAAEVHQSDLSSSDLSFALGLSTNEPSASITITAQPQSRTNIVGSIATFSVTATGIDLSYQWQTNAADIPGATNASYTAMNLQTNQSGTLFTVIITSLGNSVTSAPAILTVTNGVPPAITSQPQSRTNAAGADVAFTVTGSGTGPLRYQWQTNSVDIPGATNASYTATNVQTHQDGTIFTAVITNIAGSVTSAPAILTVTNAVPPSIVAQPQSRTNAVGASVLFTVTSSGTSPRRHQWKANSVDIPGANLASYTAANIQMHQSGTIFTVVVTNIAGSVTSAPAILTVTNAIAPSITSQPESRTNVIGTTATLSVLAAGTQPLSFHWQKGGTNLIDGGNVSGAAGSTLTLSNVVFADAGDYTVIVTNRAGSVTSVVATLTIVPAPPTPEEVFPLLDTSWKYLDNGSDPGPNWPTLAFNDAAWSNGLAELGFSSSPPENDEATVLRQTNSMGSTNITFYFRRAFDIGNPATVSNVMIRFKRDDGIVVYLNGAEVLRDNMPEGVVSNAMFATQFVPDDGAQLFTNFVSPALLRAGNNVLAAEVHQYDIISTDLSFALALSTNVPGQSPIFITSQPQSRTNLVGTDASFSVTATGVGLTYQWQTNSVDIPGATGASYTALNVRTDQSGTVFRVIISDSGTNVTSAPAILTVTNGIAPSITSQPQSRTNLVGASVPFTVSATGTSPLSYQWQTNSVDIPDATNASYTAANIQTSQSGTIFTVVITNIAGSVTSDPAILTVTNLQPPAITVHPQSQTVIAGENAVFTVTATGNAPLSYQWRFNDTNIAGATSASFTRANTQVTHAGDYTVVVSNTAGSITSAVAALTVHFSLMVSSLGTGIGDVSYQPNQAGYAPNSMVTLTATPGAGSIFTGWSGDASGQDNPLSVTMTANKSIAAHFISESSVIFYDDFESNSMGQWTTTTPPTSEMLISSTTNAVPENGFFSARAANEAARMHHNIVDDNGGVELGGAFRFTSYIWDSSGGPFGRFYTELRAYSGSGIPNQSTNTTGQRLDQLVAIGKNHTGTTGFGDTSFDNTKYQGRVAFGPGANWFNLNGPGSPSRSPGWHKFEVEQLPDGATLRFYVDGVLCRTVTNPIPATFDTLILGPGLSAAAGVANFDGIKLELLNAPVITTQPQSRTNLAGTTAQFSVTATGTAPLSYQWRRNGSNLFNGGSISGATNPVLTLANVQSADSGNFSVVVGNAFGSVTSAVAALTVDASQVIYLPIAADTFIYSGLPDNNAGGHVWFGAGTDGHGGVRRGLLSFNVSGAIPAGATINSASLEMTVARVPLGAAGPALMDLSRMLADWGEGTQTGNSGSPATPEASTWNNRFHPATGWATPGASNDAAVAASASTDAGSLVGELRTWSSAALAADVQFWLDNPAQNFGWLLRARDEASPRSVRGFASRESGPALGKLRITYTVSTAPNITTQPQSQTVIAGQDAAFNVIAVGAPPLSYQWRFNGTNIHNATAPGYTRVNAQPSDAGQYSVVVANNSGSVTSSVAILTVSPRPNLTIRLTPTNTALVLWPSPSAGFTLQQNASLTETNWMPATEGISDDGTNRFIIIDPLMGTRFYRLLK